MQVDEFLNLYQDKLDIVTEIQDLIYNANDSNLDESTVELEDIIDQNPLLKTKEGLAYLLKILKFAMISRPFYNEIHFSLISFLSESIKELFTSEELYSSFAFRFFNLKLYELGIIDISSIIKNSEKDVMSFLYFSPEIQEHCPKEYNQRLSNDNWLKQKIYSIGGYQYLSKNKRTQKKTFQNSINSINDYTGKLNNESIDLNSNLNNENLNSNLNNVNKIFNSESINNNVNECLCSNSTKNDSAGLNINDVNEFSEEEIERLSKFKEIREIGFNEFKIASAIRKDDLDGIQQIISQTNLDLETTIPRSFFERSNFINDTNPTLIEYAAFCGSINVFKFLINIINDNDNRIISDIQNNVGMTNLSGLNVQSFRNCAKILLRKSERLCKYAIAGGSYDIIHALESKKYLDFRINSKLSLNEDIEFNTNSKNLFFGLKFNFNELFNISIQFHRNEIYDYLAENCYNNFDEDILASNQDNILIENFNASILYYNIEILLKLLPIVVQNNFINYPDSDGETPLHVAAINGHIDIVRILCSIKGININSRANNLETPLQWAISYGHIDVVKYMLDLDGIDYSGENKVGISISLFILQLYSMQLILEILKLLNYYWIKVVMTMMERKMIM
ncbi:hypothetical protein M9Y10_013605 [Tritrichomonas musculus]|uniref:Ankyrin repeat protein n=1 Tax=Tritrichomonas musculus TaxID=1915356 RepID=A0ABR2KX72_9EUKA